MKPKQTLTAEINLRQMLRAFLAMGFTQAQWDLLFGNLKQRGAIERVWRDGKEIVTLWATKPRCPLHPSYTGVRRPRSRAKGCVCKLVWEANQ